MNRLQVLEDLLETIHVISKHAGQIKSTVSKCGIDCCVSRPQMQILYIIAHHEKVTVSELADRMGITPGAVTQFVDALISEKWLQKEKSEKDKRSVSILFSSEGKEKFKKLRQEHLERLLPIFDALTDQELEQLVALSKKVIVNMLHTSKNV